MLSRRAEGAYQEAILGICLEGLLGSCCCLVESWLSITLFSTVGLEVWSSGSLKMSNVGCIVDGGHRAIKYTRVGGVKGEIYNEGTMSQVSMLL
jgi:hypothetical protein